MTVSQLLKQHTQHVHWSHEQHHTSMQYYWQEGLPEEREELIEKYRVGVKRPFSWVEDENSSWRSFTTEGGRMDFFRSLHTDG